jgi:TPR repeat protein
MKKFIYIVSAVLLLASSFGAHAGGCKYRDLNDCKMKAANGDASAQTMLGVMYATGKGVPKDYVMAHMFFSIRAENPTDVGGDVGADSRDFVAKGMTSSEIEKAQDLAREWMQKHR